jgi:hypothetical protein
MHSIQATKKITMWGSTRAERELEHLLSEQQRAVRSMHFHIAQDRLIVKQLVMLAGGMKVLKELVFEYITPFDRFEMLWKTDKTATLEAFCLECRIPYQQLQEVSATASPFLSPVSCLNFSEKQEVESFRRGTRLSSMNGQIASPSSSMHNSGSICTPRAAGWSSGPKTPYTPSYEGLRMADFLKGVKIFAARLEPQPLMSMDILEDLRREIQVQFKVELQICVSLPVHNIWARSLDTIFLKNVLKAEASAWKMLYGQVLLAHAHGLTDGLLTKVSTLMDHLETMKSSKKSENMVQDMITLVSSLSDTEQVEKVSCRFK